MSTNDVSRTKGSRLARRTFLKGSAAASAVAAFSIIPAHAAPQTDGAPESTPPSEKVNVAAIGTTNRGGAVLNGLAGGDANNVVALCDVCLPRAEGQLKRYPKAKTFQDFRVMLEKMGDQIDVVGVGTPDHAHFPAAIQSMSMGKGVYVEKPLAHTFEECQLLMDAEKKYNVPCQMGNQGHSGANYYQFKTWTEAGIMRNVTRIEAFMTRPRRWHGWKINGFPPAQVAPAGMDWDLWVGPSQYHPYSKDLDGGQWRCWYEYGDGAFGDWGPHLLDTCHRFFELGLPEKVVAEKLEGPNDYIFPQASTIAFHFPERGDKPACKVTWYDGRGNGPELPEDVQARAKRCGGAGKVVFGEGMTFVGGSHGSMVDIVEKEKAKEIEDKLPKWQSGSGHFENLINAVKGTEETRSPFAVSGPLCQVFALGVIAQRLGGTLEFDIEKQEITNNDRANGLLAGPAPRKGWESFYKK